MGPLFSLFLGSFIQKQNYLSQSKKLVVIVFLSSPFKLVLTHREEKCQNPALGLSSPGWQTCVFHGLFSLSQDSPHWVNHLKFLINLAKTAQAPKWQVVGDDPHRWKQRCVLWYSGRSSSPVDFRRVIHGGKGAVFRSVIRRTPAVVAPFLSQLGDGVHVPLLTAGHSWEWGEGRPARGGSASTRGRSWGLCSDRSLCCSVPFLSHPSGLALTALGETGPLCTAPSVFRDHLPRARRPVGPSWGVQSREGKRHSSNNFTPECRVTNWGKSFSFL